MRLLILVASGFLGIRQLKKAETSRGNKRFTTDEIVAMTRGEQMLSQTLLTRDPKRYRTYSPTLRIIAPQDGRPNGETAESI